MEIELGLSHIESVNSIDDINHFDNSSDYNIQDKTRQEGEINNITKNEFNYSKTPYKYIYFSYQILCHIFLFSVFESFFFWYYIVPQENKMVKNQFKSIDMVSNLICLNTDIDLDPLFDYLEEERRNYNNNTSLKFTLLLNASLSTLIGLYNMYFKLNKYSLLKINKNIIKDQSILLILLFAYEYVFFQNVIYIYKPKDLFSYDEYLFTSCT